MLRKIIVPTVLAAALLVAAPARAQNDSASATNYLPSCAAALDILQGRKPVADSPEAAAQLRRAAMCFGAVNAVLNVQPYLQKQYAMCAPAGPAVTPAQALPVIVAYLGAHKDRLGENFHGLALAALAEKWPCKN